MAPKKLLVHCCCAHCSAYALRYWRSKGYDPTAFWYNPNIHPETEHNNRLDAMRLLLSDEGFPLVVLKPYQDKDYYNLVAGHEHERCRYCFDLRLSETSQFASDHSYDSFTTSLLISPQQRHEIIKVTGEKLAVEKGLDFAYDDLRKHYSDSRCITKPLSLYRQTYCGCTFSRMESSQKKGGNR